MNHALIFAGGTGQRMGETSVPKQFLSAYSKPIIVHTIEPFQECNMIDSIVVVCISDHIEYMRSLCGRYELTKVVSIVNGGNSGQGSIFNGLKELVRLYGINYDVVLIHDGVRPLIDVPLIEANIACVKKNGNSVTVAPATETVVLLNDEVVDKVMDRKYCRIAKAPQSFRLKDIYNAHLKAVEENKLDFIDSAMLMQHYGHHIHTVTCSSENLKITTPMDYFLFKAILDARENEQIKLL